MRGAHVQKQEPLAVRQSWRNRCHSAPPAELPGLSEPHALRQGTHTPNAAALDASQPGRFWGSPGHGRNTLFKSGGKAHVLRVAGRWLHCPGRREFVLFAGTIQNPNLAVNLDALLAEQSPNERLGKPPEKLSLPGYIWYLWRSTGIRNGTSGNRKQATGIRNGTCRRLFSVPQLSDMTHSY